MRKTIREHGSALIEVNGDTLIGRMINRNGYERDLFSIVKRGSVTPNRLSLPWQPPEYKKPANEPKEKPAPALDHTVLIAKGAEWHYWTGAPLRGVEWTRLGYSMEGWKKGASPFGFGEGTFQTELKNMKRGYSTVFLRRNFHVEQGDRTTEIGLWIDYDDAFIAYLNGKEVARVGVGRSAGKNAQGIKAREDKGFQYIVLKDAHLHVKDGENTLAIEGHMASIEGPDFLLSPSLLLED